MLNDLKLEPKKYYYGIMTLIFRSIEVYTAHYCFCMPEMRVVQLCLKV